MSILPAFDSDLPQPRFGSRRRMRVFLQVLPVVLLLSPLSLVAKTLVLHVDDDAAPNGTGKGNKPFQNLPEAIVAAQAAVASHDKIFIKVKPGNYELTKTLVVDFPVRISGTNEPVKDDNNWPTGVVVADTKTMVHAKSCIGPLISVGKEPGKVISNVTIENLTLDGALNTCPLLPTLLLVKKVQNVTIQNNTVLGLAGSGIDVSATSGLIAGNFVTKMDNCGICIGAGTSDSPTQMTVTDNRAEKNIGGALLLSGTTFPLLEVGNLLDANIQHNDLSDNNTNPRLGFGVRVLALGVEVPANQEAGKATAHFKHNRIDSNQNSIMIDAGFPVRTDGVECDKRTFTADFDLVFLGNSVTDSQKRTSLISFTRAQVETAGNPVSRWQYLHQATFMISDPDLSLALDSKNIIHKANDPYVGVCPDDSDHELLSNKLIYNGSEIAASP